MSASYLLAAADRISDELVGYRVEIIGGQLIVTPPESGTHGETLTNIMLPLMAAGLHGEHSKVLQAVGIWLPTGPADYAVPDLAVVEADCAEQEFNCCRPTDFRLVLEVASSDLSADVTWKPAAYARAGVPVYVIVDRTNHKVMVLTDPRDGDYRVHAVHHPGQSFTLPESIGAAVMLPVDDILGPDK